MDVDDLNAGYAAALLEEYLENPAAVPSEWRRLFESGDSEIIATYPGLVRLLERFGGDGNGHVVPPGPSPRASTRSARNRPVTPRSSPNGSSRD